MNIKIKKTALTLIMLPLSMMYYTNAAAFPAYNEVYCHSTTMNVAVQFNKTSHVFAVQLDGNQGVGYATEYGNNIVTPSEYDKSGNLLRLELTSNSNNWNAFLNFFSNNQLAISIPMNCQRLGLIPQTNGKQTSASMATIMSTIQDAAPMESK